MKRERRHELEKNELADWIASVLANIKPYQNAILGVVLLLVAAAVVYAVVKNNSRRSTTKAWDDLTAAMSSPNSDSVQFEDVIKKYPGTTAAHWAGVLAGEIHLNRGCGELFLNKAIAKEDLQRAREMFLQVLDECRVDTLRERATFGLAETDEARGRLKEAMEDWSSPARKESGQRADRGYQGVLNLWPAGTYTKLAEQRLEDLKRPSTREFYDRFVKWEPKPALTEEPGTPGVRPSTKLSVPDDEPVYKSADPLNLDHPKPAGTTPSGFPETAPANKPDADAPAAKQPATGPEKPATAPENPATGPEKSAAPETPAAAPEKPAAASEKPAAATP